MKHVAVYLVARTIRHRSSSGFHNNRAGQPRNGKWLRVDPMEDALINSRMP